LLQEQVEKSPCSVRVKNPLYIKGGDAQTAGTEPGVSDLEPQTLDRSIFGKKHTA
jgi:hypothetical protein